MSGALPMWGNPEYMGVLVDEVWLPLHTHKDKLMDGTWKDKDVVRDLKISRIMKKAIQTVGEEKYGRGNFFIDRFQSGEETHLTWYCRPNMNPELIEERSKNSS